MNHTFGGYSKLFTGTVYRLETVDHHSLFKVTYLAVYIDQIAGFNLPPMKWTLHIYVFGPGLKSFSLRLLTIAVFCLPYLK